MKKSLFRKIVVTTGCAGLLLSAVRCSPNTASVSKAMLEQMDMQNHAPGPQPHPVDQIDLKVHLLDQDAFDQQISVLNEPSFQIWLYDGDDASGSDSDATSRDEAFDQFRKNGSIELALPAGIQSPGKGDAYLWVDMTKYEESASSPHDFQLTLKRSLDGPRRWTLFTSPDRTAEGVQHALSALEQIVVVLPMTSPPPSIFPSPVPSSLPSPAPAADPSGS